MDFRAARLCELRKCVRTGNCAAMRFDLCFTQATGEIFEPNIVTVVQHFRLRR